MSVCLGVLLKKEELSRHGGVTEGAICVHTTMYCVPARLGIRSQNGPHFIGGRCDKGCGGHWQGKMWAFIADSWLLGQIAHSTFSRLRILLGKCQKKSNDSNLIWLINLQRNMLSHHLLLFIPLSSCHLLMQGANPTPRINLSVPWSICSLHFLPHLTMSCLLEQIICIRAGGANSNLINGRYKYKVAKFSHFRSF